MVNTSSPAGAPQTGTTTSSYDGLSKQLVGQTSATTGGNTNPSTLYELNPTGAPVGIAQTPSGGGTVTMSWLNKDARGNVTSLTDVGGNTATCSVEYDPFGGPVNPISAGAGSNNVCTAGSAAGSTGNVLWYQAGARATSGTYQDGSRTYNPATASFTTPDTYRAGTPAQDLSVGTDPLTQNTYTYVNGNPINLNDPDGHHPVDDNGDTPPYCEWHRCTAAQQRSGAAFEARYEHNLDVQRKA